MLDDPSIQLPTFEAELNNKEMELLRKFFQPKDKLWRPSLIAFPHFQAFPSRVHNVMHSFRSEMLIDAMQYLQGSSYPRDSRACFDQVRSWSMWLIASYFFVLINCMLVYSYSSNYYAYFHWFRLKPIQIWAPVLKLLNSTIALWMVHNPWHFKLHIARVLQCTSC